MNLRTTTLLIVGLTFVGLSIVLSITLRVVLMRHFEEIEQQSLLLNLERAEGVIDIQFDALSRISQEWSQQSHLVESIQAKDVEALGEHVAREIPANDVSLVIFIDQENEILYGVQVQNGEEVAFPEGLAGFLAGRELSQQVLQNTMEGLISLQETPLLLVSHPLIDAGRPVGGLVMGRYLDREELLRLGGVIQIPIELVPYTASDGGEAQLARQAFDSGETTYFHIVDEARIAGFLMLDDPMGEPAVMLRVEQSRLFYQSGQRVMGLIQIALVTVGVVFAVITIMFLELLVFSRLTRLSKEVNEIQAGESFSSRVTVSRRDELGRLSQDINAMLDALTQAQERREEAQNELRSRVDDLLALNDTAVLLSRLDATNTLENVCRLAVEKFGVELAWLGTPSFDGVIHPVAVHGCELEQLSSLSRDDENSSPAYTALDSARVVVNDQSVEFAGKRWGIQAVLPLSIESEQLSVLCLYHREAGYLRHDRIQILEAFSNLASISLQNVLLFRQVRNGRKRQETLARRLVELQEEERKRIAMELHDEVGQILTGLNLMLGVDLSVLPPEQGERLENARRLVNDLIGRVRQMSLTLRPAMLDDLGLLPTLLWHFENYTRQTAVRVHFHHDGIEGERFDPKIETAAYRVVQEALTNVARHAGVDEVTVQIWSIDRILHVQVEDEGTGFDSEHYPQTSGTFGLLGMQERAISLRGNLTIDSQPGRGTSLLIQFPLEGMLERRTYDRNHSARR